MNTKVKNGIIACSLAVVFYLAGAFIGWPGSNSVLSGDIGKAKKYSKSVVNIDVDALQDRMMNDTAYAQKMLRTVNLMRSHCDQFCVLIDLTLDKCKNKKGLNQSLETIQHVKGSADNASKALDQLVEDITTITLGKKVKGFELSLNNAFLAFNVVRQNSRVAESFIQNADIQLKENLEKADLMLTTLRNEWSVFAYTDAFMSNDQLRLADIEKMGAFATLTNEQLTGQQMGKIIQITNQDILTYKESSSDELGLIFLTHNQEEMHFSLFSQDQMAALLPAEELLKIANIGELNVLMLRHSFLSQDEMHLTSEEREMARCGFKQTASFEGQADLQEMLGNMNDLGLITLIP